MKKFLILKLVSLLLVGTVHAQSDMIHKFADAIARTEGFYHRGTLPNRLHNPGDLRSSRRDVYPGQVGLRRGYVVFSSDRWGWAALYAQIQRVIDGASTKYTLDMTFAHIARVYAASPQWPRTLCKILNISPQLTLREYLGIAPRVSFTEVQHDFPVWASGSTPMPVLQSMSLMQAQLH